MSPSPKPSPRADEWHVVVPPETRKRLKAFAALNGLTIGKAIELLLSRCGVGGV